MTTSVTLAEARALVDKSVEHARRRNLQVSVAVVDRHGHLVQLDRMVDASPMTVELSEAKARTALNFKLATSKVSDDFKGRPGDLERLQRVVLFTVVTDPGGIPIVRGGDVIGAIGVSGASAADDEQLATSALT